MRNSPVQNLWLRARLTSLSVMGLPWTAACLSGITAITAIVLPAPAQAAILSRWEYNPSSYELEIFVPGGTVPRYSLAAEPARIIIDLPNTNIGTVSHQQTYGGAIREIRVSQYEPGLTRIVLELSPGAVLAPGHVELQRVGATPGGTDEPGDRWLLRPLLVTDTSQTAAVPEASPSAEAPLQSTNPLSSPFPLPGATSNALPPLEPGAMEIPVEMPPADDSLTQEPLTNPESPSSEVDPTVGNPVLPEAALESETVLVPEFADQAVDPETDSEVAELETPDSETLDLATLDSEVAEVPDANIPMEADPMEAELEPEPSEAPIAAGPEVSVEVPTPNNSVLPDLGLEAVLPNEAIQQTIQAIDAGEVDEPQAFTPSEPAESLPESATLPSPAPIAQPSEESEPAGSATAAIETEAERPALPPALPTETELEPTIVQVPALEETDSANEESPASGVEPSEAIQAETVESEAVDLEEGETGSVAEPNAETDSTLITEADIGTDAPVDRPIQSTPSETILSGLSSPNHRLIEFGQPLTTAVAASPSAPPLSSPQINTAQPVDAGNVSSSVLLPAGTVLRLRYPGTAPLELVEGQSRQEVLILTEPIQDTAGNVIVPEGSYVIGRFETRLGTSRFVTQAISVQGHNVLLHAESGNLLSEMSDESFSQNPVQPDQVLEVQLTEHLSQIQF